MTNTSYEKRQAKNSISSWVRSDDYDIRCAYGKPSEAKLRAWEYCRKKCSEYDGCDLKVISHNTFKFSAGFEFTDKETGECKFYYITPNYDCIVDLIY